MDSRDATRLPICLPIPSGDGEFMDIEGIERSCISGKRRTRLYFAIATYEREVNEVHNRMLRRFFRKAATFRAFYIAMPNMRKTGWTLTQKVHCRKDS